MTKRRDLAALTGLPLVIINCRVTHGWPIEYIGEKTIPYAQNKDLSEAAVRISGAEVRVKEERRPAVRVHYYGQRHKGQRSKSAGIQTESITKTKGKD